ncbi:MAG: DUF3568 family protein [Alphaproteobacteria bacterium]|nr:DUF3568 family protein [Alphaproteobacteria bacterium]
MRTVRILAVVAALFALQGCVAAALTVASVAGTLGMDHTLNGIAYKTFTAPLDELQTAVIDTLDRMEMELLDTNQTDDGWRFTAQASDRKIDIDLEALSPKTTHMRVVANEGGVFLKDSATAQEIVLQTAETLTQ